MWRFAPDFGLLQNSHTGKIYTKQYCIFIESDFVSTFYFTSTFYCSLPPALGTSGNLQKCNMAQLGNCIARLRHITGVVRMTRMLRIFAKTKRMRMVILILILILILMIILTTGIISSLWKLRLCILLRGRGHKYLLLDVHDHVYKKN